MAIFLNHSLKTKSCANFANGVFGISFTKSCHILRRNSLNLQETWRINKFVGKKFLMKRRGNEYCHDAWRPWRGAKSCSTGDRPPTHYFSTGHRPGFWFLDPHFSTHNPPALALALTLIPFVATLLWWTQDKMFAWHLQSCAWKSAGNGEWKFIISILFPISPTT